MRKTRNLSILALSIALSTAALANGGIGNTYNQPTATAQGGQGGAGGKGGEGGSVLASGNSANANTNLNTNANLQGQAQGQGQFQGQGQGQHQNSQAISGGNSQSVNVAATEAAASTAYAPGLAAANGTCMGSTSVGGAGVTVGLSFGTTWTDTSCDIRYDASALAAAGQGRAAIARLCQKAEIAQAMEAAGTPCPVKPTKGAAPTAGYTGNDPFVLRRLASN